MSPWVKLVRSTSCTGAESESSTMPSRLDNLTAPAACQSIDDVRAAIDVIDQLIVEAIGKRFEYVHEVTRFKTTREDVHAAERYQAVLAQRRIWATQHGLNPDVIDEMYRNLIGHFINHELTVLDLHEPPRADCPQDAPHRTGEITGEITEETAQESTQETEDA